MYVWKQDILVHNSSTWMSSTLINDLPSVATNSLIKIFADDTKVFKTNPTIQDAEDLQADIDRLAQLGKSMATPLQWIKM